MGRYTTPSPQPVRSAESNVKSYRVETELAELIIVIVKTECTNAMTGKVLPYKVNISCRKMVNASFVRIQGCGEYKRDKRLHESWMLEKMGKEKIGEDDFAAEIPRIEIDADTNTFLGFAGCNHMQGKLFFVDKILRFSQIVTTKMACASIEKVHDFLEALKKSKTCQFGNGRLEL